MQTASNTYSFKGIFICVLCAVFFMYEFLLRTVIGTFQGPIMEGLTLTAMEFAFLSSTAYMAVYCVMQIPAGLLTNKIGLKYALLLAIGICVISIFGFTASKHYWLAIAFRMLMGFGSSFGFICLLLALYDWMPKKQMGMIIGLAQFIGTMGPMIAAGPLNAVSESGSMPWQRVFMGLAIIGCLLGVLILLFVKNNRDKLDSFLVVKRPLTIKSTLLKLIKQKQPWLIAAYSASIYCVIEYLSENEGIGFIQLCGHSKAFASYMITLIWIGYGIGCPLLGFLSDYFKRRKQWMILAALLSLTALWVILYHNQNPLLLTIAFLALGLGASGQSVGFALMAEQCERSYLAAGLALNNAMISIVCAVNAPITGWLLDTIHPHHETLEVVHYQKAFAPMLGILAISLVLVARFIQETYCRPTKEHTIIKHPSTWNYS